MSRARLLLLLVAVSCAVAAALLARSYLLVPPVQAPAHSAVQPPEPRAEVLIAMKDLAMGERLASGALEWRQWPASNVAENMITRSARPDALESLADARARLPILTGEPIVDRKIVQTGSGMMSAILPPGMRAIAIDVSERSAVSGFVLPNDRVDVIVADAAGSRTILTNVRVLALNQTFGQPDAGMNSLTGLQTAVLELDPAQAEAVATAAAAGTLSLALRSIAEGGDAGIADERPELQSQRSFTIIRFGVETTVRDD